MTEPTADTVDMSWYLNRIAEEAKGVQHVLLLSSDGLVLAHSDDLDRDVADKAAASVCGLTALSQDLSEFCNGRGLAWRRSVIDLDEHCVVLLGAGERSVIAVSIAAELTSPEVASATAATVKAVAGMRHLLSAQERQ